MFDVICQKLDEDCDIVIDYCLLLFIIILIYMYISFILILIHLSCILLASTNLHESVKFVLHKKQP